LKEKIIIKFCIYIGLILISVKSFASDCSASVTIDGEFFEQPLLKQGENFNLDLKGYSFWVTKLNEKEFKAGIINEKTIGLIGFFSESVLILAGKSMVNGDTVELTCNDQIFQQL
jgi:hypothetical protein